MAVLEQIRASPGISRVELARATGLTEGTISMAVREIIADGFVVETGYGESTGGKRRTLLEIDPAAGFAAGVSIAREMTRTVLVDLNGGMLEMDSLEGADTQLPDSLIRDIAASIERLVRRSEIDVTRLIGVGVATPGPLDAVAGVLQGEQPTPDWKGFPLVGQLRELVNLPVVLDNDATCAAIGDHWVSRSGPPPAVSATVYMADGIGCGILVDGLAMRGSSSNAGELGHISLDSRGPLCHCGARGCVEMYANPRAVVGEALSDPLLATRLTLDPTETSRRGFDRIASAAVSGDEACRRILASAAEALGRGIVTLANLLDLDEVVLAGPAFAIAGELYRDGVQAALNRSTFMRRIHGVRVVISGAGDEAAAIGAATLQLRKVVAASWNA